MAVYAVGDVQGCRDELEALLDHAGFDAASDTLWLVGDLVNRGPQSLEVLRFVRSLGTRAVCVLGNHDITLLAQAAGARESDGGMRDILEAPDREDWIDWLRHRPVLHHDPALGYVLVHAGLLPQWTLEEAKGYARELEEFLRSDRWSRKIGKLYGSTPKRWKDGRTGMDRLRLICNTFTRLRYLSADGTPDWKCKAGANRCPEDLLPWFRAPGRRTRDERIVFGHWSTLGYHHGDGVLGLDTGCVWGGCLTAVRLDAEPPARLQIDCAQWRSPGQD